MTLESCTWFCSSRQYAYAGLEYSQECYCGNALFATHGDAVSASECSSACTGNSAEACGGNFRMQIYQNPNPYGASNPSPAAGDMGRWAYQGCQADKIDMRTLPEPINNITDGMTAEKCVNACQDGGFELAGLEMLYAPAWCGHNLGNSTSAPDTDCNLRCAGNNTEICGGANRLTVYKDMGAPATSSSPGNSTSICLEQTTEHDFTLHVLRSDGSTKNIFVYSISEDVAILTVRDSLCTTDRTLTCTTQTSGNGTQYTAQYLYHGEYHAEQCISPATNGTTTTAVSGAPSVGQGLVLQQFEHAETYRGYCTMVC
ncbi:hypothetical protein C8F04DRAFT_968849 [Mycena alexandri]|uniref:WSC domain-containing protein n=1 Tax=Mycena alexandri TaxID=1745969 RepID=A0AAD6WTK7_9AGAR|nr:hypothetical protein C8F04DRAFT_968849 [Mycena alexandri]